MPPLRPRKLRCGLRHGPLEFDPTQGHIRDEEEEGEGQQVGPERGGAGHGAVGDVHELVGVGGIDSAGGRRDGLQQGFVGGADPEFVVVSDGESARLSLHHAVVLPERNFQMVGARIVCADLAGVPSGRGLRDRGLSA